MKDDIRKIAQIWIARNNSNDIRLYFKKPTWNSYLCRWEVPDTKYFLKISLQNALKGKLKPGECKRCSLAVSKQAKYVNWMPRYKKAPGILKDKYISVTKIYAN